MARIPKPKKRKQRKPEILNVPVLALKLHDQPPEGYAKCDKCEKVVAYEEADEWLIGLGVTDILTLAFSSFCPECYPTLEWGQVYCPNPGPGAPCMPIGAS